MSPVMPSSARPDIHLQASSDQPPLRQQSSDYRFELQDALGVSEEGAGYGAARQMPEVRFRRPIDPVRLDAARRWTKGLSMFGKEAEFNRLAKPSRHFDIREEQMALNKRRRGIEYSDQSIDRSAGQ